MEILQIDLLNLLLSAILALMPVIWLAGVEFIFQPVKILKRNG